MYPPLVPKHVAVFGDQPVRHRQIKHPDHRSGRYVNDSGKLRLAGVPEHIEDFISEIGSFVETNDGDVIIISQSENNFNSDRAAIAAALKTI